MLLKRAAMAGGLSVLLVLSTGVGVASAKGKVKAQGTVTCGGLHGTGALNPGLSVTGSPGGMKINYKATFAGNCNSNVTTPPGDVVTGGSVKGSGFYDPPPLGGNASACVNFLGGDVVGTIKETIQWTTTGPPIAPTHITYQMQTGTVTAPPATITLVMHTTLSAFEVLVGMVPRRGVAPDDTPAREHRWFDPHEAVSSTIPCP